MSETIEARLARVERALFDVHRRQQIRDAARRAVVSAADADCFCDFCIEYRIAHERRV